MSDDALTPAELAERWDAILRDLALAAGASARVQMMLDALCARVRSAEELSDLEFQKWKAKTAGTLLVEVNDRVKALAGKAP